MFKTILVPLDGSARSEAVLFHVQRLLLKTDSKLQLLRVVSYQRPPLLDQVANLGAGELDPAVRNRLAREEMEKLVQSLTNQGFQAEGKVVLGEPATAILQEVRRTQPELVAMATHGRSGVSRLLRGSVAERVLSRCPVPLLMLNPPEKPDAWHLRYDKLLVPLDGSERSARVLPLVRGFAQKFESKVVLTHVMPSGLPVLHGPEMLEELAGDLRESGLNVATRSESGEVVSRLLSVCDDESPDLLVMATHGASGLERWAFGSVALKLVSVWRGPILMLRNVEQDWKDEESAEAPASVDGD